MGGYHYFTDTFIVHFIVHCPFSQICTSPSRRRTPHAHGLPSPFHPCKISYSETSCYVAYGRFSFGPGVLTSFPALLYCKTKDSDSWCFHILSLCPSSFQFVFLPLLLPCLHAPQSLFLLLSLLCHFSDLMLTQLSYVSSEQQEWIACWFKKMNWLSENQPNRDSLFPFLSGANWLIGLV